VSKSYRYRTYGLILQSPIRLPELVVGEGKPDVVIRFGELEYRTAEGSCGASDLQIEGEDIYLFWNDIGRFLVRGGKEIIMQPLPGVGESVLRLFILGTTLAMLLWQRGLAVFHASAVAIGKEVIAFAGVKGAGKSTLAASLHAGGHELVADDIVAIDTSHGQPLVLPGFPHLKLWPDSVNLLGSNPGLLPRLRPELEKRSYLLSERFAEIQLPLRCFCIINPGSVLGLEPLRPREGLAALMPYWYGARFGMERLRSLGLPNFFQQCVSVTDAAPVYRLKRPQAMPTLSDINRLITEDLMYGCQLDRDGA
jgi:hypothetical protein